MEDIHAIVRKKRGSQKQQSWKGDNEFKRLEVACKEKNVTPMFGEKKIDLKLWNRMRFVSRSVITFKCRKCEVTVDKPVYKILYTRIVCACHNNFHWKTAEKYKFSAWLVKSAIAI